jgi:hypothetical protein
MEKVQVTDHKKFHAETLVHIAILASKILKAFKSEDTKRHSNKQLKEDSLQNRIFEEILNYPKQIVLSDLGKWSPEAIKQAKKNIFQLFS